MKCFKPHNIGFSLIETMFALLLLTTMGTSLFMIQSNIFFNTYKNHHKVAALLHMNALHDEFAIKIIQLLKQKKSLLSLVVKKEIEQPSLTLSMTTKKIPESSQLSKHFEKHVLIVNQKAQWGTKTEQSIGFVFSPDHTEVSS